MKNSLIILELWTNCAWWKKKVLTLLNILLRYVCNDKSAVFVLHTMIKMFRSLIQMSDTSAVKLITKYTEQIILPLCFFTLKSAISTIRHSEIFWLLYGEKSYMNMIREYFWKAFNEAEIINRSLKFLKLDGDLVDWTLSIDCLTLLHDFRNVYRPIL